MPLQATSGAASYDAFGGGVAAVPNYIEDVFSDYLFSGTSASNTINNGVDASGKGALVWIKDRGAASTPHMWFDTIRGVGKYIQSNSTGSQGNIADTLTAFNSNGFTLGADSFGVCNASGHNYVSWTFRKQPKFFDVVTFTSNSSGGCTFNHSLGASPGFVTIKRTDSTSNWVTYHRSVGNDAVIYLNTTAASASVPGCFTPSSTQFTVQDGVFANSATYVAYLFAHNAGGFGLTGTDNVISCGSYTGNGSTSGPSITLGYEPQWILTKNATSSGWDWNMFDNMRGLPVGSGELALQANLSDAESGTLNWIDPTATGFNITSSNAQINQSGSTILYIAIRRGPMKVPTSGTSVYQADTYSGTGASNRSLTTLSSLDFSLIKWRTGNPYGDGWSLSDRLRGIKQLATNSTDGETSWTDHLSQFGPNQNTVLLGNGGTVNGSGMTYVNYAFRRAPSFFDEVCWTASGNAWTSAHNLGVSPELIISKNRTGATTYWYTYASSFADTKKYLLLNTTDAVATNGTSLWSLSSSSVSGYSDTSGGTGVAYLFATCAGVQYINSYVGDGTTGRTINCGFTGGARFVCIKATSTSGSWWTFDSARGIVTNSDPALQLNSAAAEITSADAIDTAASGFIVNQEATCSLNASGVTYLVWAIA